VCAFYAPPSGAIQKIALKDGYHGLMTFQSPVRSDPNCASGYSDLSHTYTMQVGSLIERDDMVMPVTLTSPTSAAVDELYDALTVTFDASAGLYWPGCQPGGCTGTGLCDYEPDMGSGYGSFAIPQLALTIRAQSDSSTGGAKVVEIDLAVKCSASADD
jgi:hypothetical protein